MRLEAGDTFLREGAHRKRNTSWVKRVFGDFPPKKRKKSLVRKDRGNELQPPSSKDLLASPALS